jgi:outer membrane protein assembly factor BamB
MHGPTLPVFRRFDARALPAFALALLVFACSASAATYVASPEVGWPQFRGPQRNGISLETNLLQVWPEGGPPVLWSVTNLGAGYASPIIARDRLYLPGDVGEVLRISALNLQGKLVWQATNGASWKTPFPGARASCAYSAGKLYHLNAHGLLACFDARNGDLVWQVDTVKVFESRVPTWGVSECLLVYGDQVIVTPGGRKASMAALDKNTGKTVWTAEPLPNDKPAIEGPAYASPVLAEVLGQRHIIGVTARHVFGVDAATGKRQWHLTMPTQYEVLGSSPVVCGDGVFMTGPDAEGGGQFLRFAKRDGNITAERAWTTTLDTCHGGIIPLDGFLYGSWYRSFNGWGCVNAADGSVPYRDNRLPMGSAIYSDKHLYCLSQTGAMALVKLSPEKWEIISRFQFATEPKKDVWTHPVILNGRLYLRHQQILRCFDLQPH